MRQINFPDPEDPHRYDDMLGLPHPVSRKHPQMSLDNRAAQFSPFAALTGYEVEVTEAGRMTDRRIELSECEKAELNQRLQCIQGWIDQQPGKWASLDASLSMPQIRITHFVPDERNDGGRYDVAEGTVRRIDPFNQSVVMTDGRVIPIPDIIVIESNGFRTGSE